MFLCTNKGKDPSVGVQGHQSLFPLVGFYNWRLPHQWCCSTEGSRHLCTPVGIRIIA